MPYPIRRSWCYMAAGARPPGAKDPAEIWHIGWALDLDGKCCVEDDPGADLTGYDLPDTYFNFSPRGGRHRLYEGSISGSASKLGFHIDRAICQNTVHTSVGVADYVGRHHGDRVKMERLPLLMATDIPTGPRSQSRDRCSSKSCP